MAHELQIKPVAHIRTDFPTKFGIPRQAGLAENLKGKIVFEPAYRIDEALRGLEGFSHLWLIWGFSENMGYDWTPTVRPPRLGGNVRMGVFATRSPFRPNGLGLSCVRLLSIQKEEGLGTTILVGGADMVDGTPIYDVKPYAPYADCHPEARGGFTDNVTWNKLTVVFPDTFHALFNNNELENLRQILELDPRPHYQHQDERIYGMNYKDQDIHFRVTGDVLEVLPN